MKKKIGVLLLASFMVFGSGCATYNSMVPDWAIDMETEVHPNDIRTLVKVINLLGHEVNFDQISSGTTLLYLYNDGSVEKKLYY